MTNEWLVLIESNTTGSGRLFCAAARRMGLRPLLLSRDPSRYPYVKTDEIDTVVTDTNDLASVAAACAHLHGGIAGVTSSSEYYIAGAAAFARSLGLPHPDPDAVTAVRDKEVLRSRLPEAGPSSGLARNADEAVGIARRIGFPVVVKPVVGSGSVGVRLCGDSVAVKSATTGVLDAPATAVHAPAAHAVLVEGYLAGPEFSVETFDEQVVGITAKHLGPEPYFVETGHDFPASLPDQDRSSIGQAAVSALRAMGLGWGAAHVELRLTLAGPRIVEINPRLAGGMIPRVVQEATGIDLISAVVAKAVGRELPLRPRGARSAAIRFMLADKPGRLLSLSGVPQAADVPGVAEVGIVRDVGQLIALDHSFRDRLAYVIAATDHPSAGDAAEAAVRLLAAEISPE
jgi:biotin carboxylase